MISDEQIIAAAGEPVAHVGPVFQLFYRGAESIAAIAKRRGLKVGSNLYTADAILSAAKPLRERIAELEADNNRMLDAFGEIIEYSDDDAAVLTAKEAISAHKTGGAA